MGWTKNYVKPFCWRRSNSIFTPTQILFINQKLFFSSNYWQSKLRPQFEGIFLKSPVFSSNWNDVIKIPLSAWWRRPIFCSFSCEILKSWDIWRFFLRFPSKMIHFCQWWERAFTEKLKEQCWSFLPKGILASDNINKHGVAFPKFFGKFFDFMPTTSKSDRWSLQAQKISYSFEFHGIFWSLLLSFETFCLFWLANDRSNN